MDNSVIDEQIRGLTFSDDRLRQRYESCLSMIESSDWSQSFPMLIKNSYALKGFYRFINNARVTQSTFIEGYKSGLACYSKQQSDQESEWYLIHDTMYVEFNDRELDLGYTQGEDTNGFLLHHGLLLDQDHVPLGLLHQGILHRDRENFGKREDCKKKVIDEKESSKWLDGIGSGKEFSGFTGRKLIHLLDREADIADVINLFLSNGSEGSGFIIRARHDRSTLTHSQRDREENVGLFRLFKQIKESIQYKKIKRTLRNKDGKPYEAECWLRYEAYKFRGIEKVITCVFLEEVSSTEESKMTGWYLLTNLSVQNFEEAEEVVENYTKRWTVEDFHKCYKTGCSIEKRQFDSREPLCTVIGFLGLLAIQLLRSRYLARVNPESSFETVVPQKGAQELARKVAKKYLKPIDLTIAQEGTMLWWILLLGRMGGHQGFKSKGMPGWQTLWKGMNYFNTLLEGYEMQASP
ncbi:MAG: IS4 family transposase [Bacteroidota bacterium]